MKVYISASCKYKASYLALSLAQAGYDISSGWHDREMSRTSKLSEGQKSDIALAAREVIKQSDILVLMDDPDMVPGGKFVDVGIALGAGKKVFVLGRRENIKMYDPEVQAFDTLPELISGLADV
jgi:hypothetical protein